MPGTLAAWSLEREEIRQTLWRLLGDLPPRPRRPVVRVLRRENRNGYVLERFAFDNGAGARVPGYLLLPTHPRGTRAPAILYCHWHGGDYRVGKDELFQAAHTPVAPGPVLAARGYVVMGIDAYGFGERRGFGPGGPTESDGTEEASAAKLNLWMGRTLWGMMLRDDLMALDYLQSRAEVDPARIGVTGISMGATRTWWLMALDERLRAGVAVGCLTHYRSLVASRALASHGIYYFVPGMLRHFDTDAIVSLIAPRPVLFLTGDRDSGSPARGVRRIASVARRVYQLHGQSDHFKSLLYPGVGHVYLPDMWDRAVAWMTAHLG